MCKDFGPEIPDDAILLAVGADPIGVLIALAVLVVLCLIAYAAVRAVGRFTLR